MIGSYTPKALASCRELDAGGEWTSCGFKLHFGPVAVEFSIEELFLDPVLDARLTGGSCIVFERASGREVRCWDGGCHGPQVEEVLKEFMERKSAVLRDNKEHAKKLVRAVVEHFDGIQ